MGGSGGDVWAGAVRDDDEDNLEDLKDAEAALIKAHQALTRAMAGVGPLGERRERQDFVFQVGFARGRLSRVTGRIYRIPEET